MSLSADARPFMRDALRRFVDAPTIALIATIHATKATLFGPPSMLYAASPLAAVRAHARL